MFRKLSNFAFHKCILRLTPLPGYIATIHTCMYYGLGGCAAEVAVTVSTRNVPNIL